MLFASLLASLLISAPGLTPIQSGPQAPYTWKNAQIVGGGFVTGIITNPSKSGPIYARTDVGGAYRWSPEQNRWQPLTDFAGMDDMSLTGIESIASDPVDPRRVYLAAGIYQGADWPKASILCSSDYGNTFQRSQVPFQMGGNEAGRFNGERLAIDPFDHARIFFGSRDAGLWMSTDFGANWHEVAGFPEVAKSKSTWSGGGYSQPVGIVSVLCVPDDANRRRAEAIYAAVSTRETSLFVSHDKGTSWTPVRGQPSGLRPIRLAASRDGNLFVTYGDEPGPNSMTNGAVWRYTFGYSKPGASRWTDVSPVHPTAAEPFGYGGVTVDHKHPHTVMVTTFCRWKPGDEVFRSLDDGQTWRGIGQEAVRDASNAPWLKFGRPAADIGHWMGDVEIDPNDSNHALYVTGATIWATHDLLQADQATAAGPQKTHWIVEAKGIEETVPLALISPPKGAHLLSGVGDIDGFLSTDLSHSPPEGTFTDLPRLTNTESMDFAEAAPEVTVRVGSIRDRSRGATTGRFSQDGGKTWFNFQTEPEGSRGSGSIGVSADAKTLVYAPRGAAPGYSIDLGAIWLPCQGLPPGVRVASDRIDANRFYALLPSTGQVFISYDSGRTFTPTAKLPVFRGAGMSNSPSLVTSASGEVWVTLGKGGAYRSSDGKAFMKVPQVDVAQAVGFGAAKPGRSNLAIFLAGKVNGTTGVYRSDDAGETWVPVLDPRHQFGWINMLIGDPRVYGRVYLATGGRGVVYGDIRP